ncbi:MAG TPA: DUF1553 domain-containing protein [Bryobacteraceae bacterium]|nr:DUF1553 domain-containing protein [Bryobacteraceae bacterium]
MTVFLGCSSLLSIAQTEKTTSAGDCSFQLDPDRFLSREGRVRREVNDRVLKMARSARAPAPAAAESLPQRNFIDQEIFGKLIRMNTPAANLSTDTEFLRRIYLDLTGRIPSPDDIRAFLADSSPKKRDAVIDKLLYSSEFSDRWVMWLGDLLQNTATLNSVNFNRNVQGRNVFFAYIQNAVYNAKSLKDIAVDVITGRGNNYILGNGPANFPMAGSTSMGPIQDTYDNMLVKSASTFLGLTYYDCILCHNGRGHLDQISLWGSTATRAEAQSMAAFFSRTRFTRYPEAAPPPGVAASYMYNSYEVSDAASGTYDLNTTYGNRPNRVKIGTLVNLTPSYRGTGAAPKDGAWRAAFAQNLVNDPLFARNLANRLWKQMFNLGLIDPVDTIDPARLDANDPPPAPWTLQPTHPELLDKLAQELIDSGFQIRPFLQTLVQSTAYQLSSNYGGPWSPEMIPLFARHYPRRMEGEEVHDAIAKSTGVLGSYGVQYMEGKTQWAMQLPEPVEPRGNEGNANTFMNTFFRGNRDNQQRNQSGSIQQQLFLMNDQFVTNRVKVANSPKLKALAAITNNADLVDEAFLTFLSRYPTESERPKALAFLANANTAALRNTAVEDLAWVCINKVDFLFSY